MDRIRRGGERLYLRADRLLRGRLTVVARTVVAFDQDDGAVVSRSIAYYALFSLFPLLLLIMSFASSVLASEEVKAIILQTVENIIPFATALVEENISQVLESRSTIGVLAGLGLLWSASGVFTALYRAVNRAWGNPKSQLFWAEKVFGVTVVIVVGLLLVATTLVSTIISIVQNSQLSVLGWQPLANATSNRWVGLLSGLMPTLVSVVTFMILYRTIPYNQVSWRDVWLGGLIAGLLWEAGRQIYAWYLANFARYSLIYGSVGVIIGFLLWAYLSAMILLLGAEFTAQHTRWRRTGRPVESRPPEQWLEEWPD